MEDSLNKQFVTFIKKHEEKFTLCIRHYFHFHIGAKDINELFGDLF